MSEIAISKRFALAVYELAKEQKISQTVRDDMDLISNTIRASRELKVFLSSPIVKTANKLKIISDLFESKVSDLTHRFIQLIAKHKRENLIGLISDEYLSLYNEDHNIIIANITTAVKLDNELRKRLIQIVEKQTEKTVILKESVDTSLIGGFLLNVNNKEFDTSLSKGLKKLRKEFNVNVYQKGF